VVPFEIPDDANGAQVIGATEIKDLLDNLRSRAKLQIDRAGLLVNQSLIPVGLVGLLPEVESRSRYSEVSARLAYVPDLLCML
jgi:hypothetical protein